MGRNLSKKKKSNGEKKEKKKKEKISWIFTQLYQNIQPKVGKIEKAG